MKKLIIVTGVCAALAFTACKGTGAANNTDSGVMTPSDTGAGVKPVSPTGLGGKSSDTMKKTPKDDTIPGGNGTGNGGSVTPKRKP
jgi:hypothetical protein